MELKVDEKAICAQCKKNKIQADICRAKDKSMREQVEVEFSVCGVCGRGYCSLQSDPDNRICEFCETDIYNNVLLDGMLEQKLTWSKKK